MFDHTHGFLRIFQDQDTQKVDKPIKVVRVDHIPSKKIEAILAHPQMTKKAYPYLVVQAAGRVSLIRTSGIWNACTTQSSKESVATAPRLDFVGPKDRALLTLHSNSMKGRRSSQATELHVFGCREVTSGGKQAWTLWHNSITINSAIAPHAQQPAK